jgi:hypothetical protein
MTDYVLAEYSRSPNPPFCGMMVVRTYSLSIHF